MSDSAVDTSSSSSGSNSRYMIIGGVGLLVVIIIIVVLYYVLSAGCADETFKACIKAKLETLAAGTGDTKVAAFAEGCGTMDCCSCSDQDKQWKGLWTKLQAADGNKFKPETPTEDQTCVDMKDILATYTDTTATAPDVMGAVTEYISEIEGA